MRAILILAAVAVHPLAYAGEGERAAAQPLLPAYRQECSACHVAYPPRMLPAASWQRLLSDLPHHFGTDASVDPATLSQLSGWLAANAGTGRRAREAPPQDRITRTAWFVHEHSELPASVWQRSAIRSPSNCAACHTGAERGVFHEHDVRIPR